MYLQYFNDVISHLAVITTVLQFLSGVLIGGFYGESYPSFRMQLVFLSRLVCKQYVVNGTTAEASPLPFICGYFSSALWLLYGLLRHDDKIIFVNIIGFVLMLSYTIVFYIYTFKKSNVLKQTSSAVIMLVFVVTYACNEQSYDLLINRIGLLSCSVTLITIVAPMSKLLYVFKVKNTECLPFPMILMSFFVSTLWFFYGVIVQDPFLELPNFIGAVLALSQLSLFVIYRKSSNLSSLSTKNVMAC